eukprot:CAMPEP_0179006090 /NCGR_PEP_ID=MMETSP0795-20121207/14339_1 /TAXON_ID=88552 /ORGANISM="Amoebophrya sp., Strain Ameob2" /LENGTH=122 /DNA_ID=CAMNT_0020700769 /DNA_START=14 /DNA_END=382 /DNA_ORIENTATION=-
MTLTSVREMPLRASCNSVLAETGNADMSFETGVILSVHLRVSLFSAPRRLQFQFRRARNDRLIRSPRILQDKSAAPYEHRWLPHSRGLRRHFCGCGGQLRAFPRLKRREERAQDRRFLLPAA